MASVTLFHNPNCSKSRGALEILREDEVEHRVVEYLSQPLGRETLERILDLIPDPPTELVRKDKRFAELGLDAHGYESAEAVVALLLKHPELMQRPIAVVGNKAVIARPSDRVRQIL
jgi:arsenate reductase